MQATKKRKDTAKGGRLIESREGISDYEIFLWDVEKRS